MLTTDPTPGSGAAVRVDWCEPGDSAALRALLDDGERARYASLRQPDDRARFVTGRALVKTAAAAVLGRPATEIHLALRCPRCGGDHGKPTIDGVEFSISHAGDRVAVAMGRTAPVGLDVERIDPSDLAALAEEALSEAERAEWDRLAANEQASDFFRRWARKEAVLKCTGAGLLEPLKDVVILPPGDAEFWLTDLDLGDGYAAALAVRTGTSPDLTVERRDPLEG